VPAGLLQPGGHATLNEPDALGEELTNGVADELGEVLGAHAAGRIIDTVPPHGLKEISQPAGGPRGSHPAVSAPKKRAATP